MVQSFDANAVFSNELLADERILWTGQPDPRRHLSAEDLFVIPFSILWCGSAVFWEGTALGLWGENVDGPGDPPLFFVLWGIPFVLVGLYMVFGRFLYRALRKRRTFYAVTDRRVLSIVRTRRGDQLQAAFLDKLPSIDQRVRRDGSGSITFGAASPWAARHQSTGLAPFTRGNPTAGNAVAFHDVPNVRAVIKLVSDQRRR